MPYPFHENLNDVTNLIGKVHTWPHYMKRIVLSRTRPNNTERFTLIWFLRHNGVREAIVERLFNSTQWTPGGIMLRWNFDEQALRHIRYLLKLFNEKPNKYNTWDLTAGMSTWAMAGRKTKWDKFK